MNILLQQIYAITVNYGGYFLGFIVVACIIGFHRNRKLMGAKFGKSFNCLTIRLPGRYFGDDLIE